MTVNKRYFKEDFYNEYAIKKEDIIIAVVDSGSNARRICNELNALHEENEELKNAIIGKIQYGEDLEKFAIEKGLIQEDWARFDDYD